MPSKQDKKTIKALDGYIDVYLPDFDVRRNEQRPFRDRRSDARDRQRHPENPLHEV